ncbi:polysaccharide deacetylase family protein [Actinomadura terrae]|uniref:polysaccharide deacetylase family protein n=1 Tax=Actinomadura terrae TaxID=604353 RepID=UPI001FA768F1|nr:polysaccharide deacetylase family protein [Actinomadura terrae]
MLYSGVSWGATGYEVEVVDRDGRQVAPPTRFGADRVDDMIGFLRDTGRAHADTDMATVVDSTNGVLDGRMMAAGLTMYRADPPALPERPVFGSVPAGALARAAARDLSALARLERTSGTQTGREDVLRADIAASAERTAALTGAGRCLGHGDRSRREVALTFDDGPLPPYTGRVMDVLERYGVPATFFCVGINVEAGSEEVARMREQGHTVANHTWSHPFLPELTRSQLAAQIDRTNEAVAGASGGAAPTLFRPPYGSRTPQVLDWLEAMDPTVVLWDVEPDDWSMPGADEIARIVLDGTRPGSIILLHDGGGDRSQTVDSLSPIIEGLLADDYTFVSVEDMTAAAQGVAAC